MTPEIRKERVLSFLRLMDCKNPEALGELITDDFEYELIFAQLPNGPIRGREAFMTAAGAFFSQMFPNGIRFQFLTTIAEGEQVAVEAESNAIAFNGREYHNRYHFHFKFAGDRIALGREYCDSNLAREILFP